MIRISSLPIAKFCAKAPELSAEHGAGRAAFMSSAFHAMLAEAPDARAKWLRLTSKEQTEISGWKRPTDLIFEEQGERVILDYASAVKEHRVALGPDCQAMAPGSAEALTEGTLDFGWVRNVSGSKVAYVGDIKKSSFTSEGPMTLQLIAYAFGFALERACDAFCTALWIAEDGEWIWGEMVELGSKRSVELWEELVAAATNVPTRDNGFATGPHCSGCYARTNCPEYITKALKSEHKITPALNGEITEQNALEVLLAAQALGELADAAKANLKELVRSGLVIRNGSKKWGLKNMPGRESVSAAELRQGLGTEAERYIKRGAPFQSPGWVKA